jgi:hypothetical protein
LVVVSIIFLLLILVEVEPRVCLVELLVEEVLSQ